MAPPTVVVKKALESMTPWTPITASEMGMAAKIVKEKLGDVRFESIDVKEPEKHEVRSGSWSRRVVANAYAKKGVWAVEVDVEKEVIVEETFHEGKYPMISLEEFGEIEEAVKADPRFQEACKLRGIEDMSLVCVDPWSSAGNHDKQGEAGKFISHTFAWVRNSALDNLYAHPIEGVNAVVDIKTMEVIRVDDYGVVPVPKIESNFDRTFLETERTDLLPIHVTQPEGVSFTLDESSRKLDWYDWSLVIGFNAREGLTLHDVQFQKRPVMYRVSLAEMVVPYGTPDSGHYRKNVFDIGEYGLGKLTNSLRLGCDCLGSIAYLPAVIATIDGSPTLIDKAVCIHEEDDGLAWKHFDFRTERTESRRARKLIISAIATVGNYEYGLYYYFHVDGSFEVEIKATGIINTSACLPGEPSKFAAEVSPGVQGHIHQHVFCCRMDLAVDGDLNTVLECDTVPETDPEKNPYGNAFYVQETQLQVEGPRDVDFHKARYWKFASSDKKNAVGKPTAFKLEPTSFVPPFVQPHALSAKRAVFARHPLWITPYAPSERFPAGDFMNHSDGTDGLPAFVAQNRPVANKDLVAWYSFGLHHLPRPEDFPVQPCISAGFKLVPAGFFDRNPCLDLPATSDPRSLQVNAACCHDQVASSSASS